MRQAMLALLPSPCLQTQHREASCGQLGLQLFCLGEGKNKIFLPPLCRELMLLQSVTSDAKPSACCAVLCCKYILVGEHLSPVLSAVLRCVPGAACLPSHLDATSWGSSRAAGAEKCSCLMIVSALGLGQLPLCSLCKACHSTGSAPFCPVYCGTLGSPGISVLWADGGAGPAVAWLGIQHMLFPALQAVLAAVIPSSLIAVQHREAALGLNLSYTTLGTGRLWWQT